MVAALLKIRKGDEIIIPAHTYCASAIPFARNGAKIIWADINPKTRTIDLNDVKKKISKKTKAIVIVHLYGYAVDVNQFKKINREIKIVEDCAQSFGAEINNSKAGTIGDFGCFSFHAQKNITTLGEGGAIFVKNDKLSKKVPGLRHNGHCNYGINRKYYWKPAMGDLDMDLDNRWPYKFTLSEIQCAAGHLMLDKLDKLNDIRIKRAKKFINKFEGEVFSFNGDFKKRRHVYHLLSAHVKPTAKINNHKIIELMYKKFGIKCAVQYYPLYRYPLFKKMGVSNQHCPNTDAFFDNMISFPFHVWMSEKNFNYLINSLDKVVRMLNDKEIIYIRKS
ncbi:aminotransferase class V-fold PLP-dependent enzyme [Candidatus Pelagibacter bacterium nBUS_28]|uniref:aminotransferase class V-fold PLP-dependent enzyme n=1 Tax=Candidatus Pelagibacter bacterium nBUS_28 TaxID=3374189 RepID=UPI003EBBE9C0